MSWTAVEPTLAEYSWRTVNSGGVGVLIVSLRGSVSRYNYEVHTLTEALDRVATKVGDAAEVAVLNVLEFSNADGDEAGVLTGVFSGLPCCWATHEWEAQDEKGRRWDLPRPRWLAPTEEAAIDGAVSARLAGRYKEGARECTFTERGFEVRDTNHGVMTSLYHHNRLVERVIHPREAEPVIRVFWPFADRSGQTNEAMRRGARLLYEGDRLVEVDLDPWQTDGVVGFGADWLESIADLDSIKRLVLRNVLATDEQVIDALNRFPQLQELDVRRTKITRRTINAILEGAGPALEELMCDEALEPQESSSRPGLTIR